MTAEDAALLAGFETATLAEFHHRDHVHVAWLYLRREPLLRAVERFSADLRRFAEAKGRPDLYHETVTWAFLFLIYERMGERMGTEAEDFIGFAVEAITVSFKRPV